MLSQHPGLCTEETKLLQKRKKDLLDYFDFRSSVVQELTHPKLEYSTDSDIEIDSQIVKHHRGTIPQPPDSLRRNGNLHLP